MGQRETGGNFEVCGTESQESTEGKKKAGEMINWVGLLSSKVTPEFKL